MNKLLSLSIIALMVGATAAHAQSASTYDGTYTGDMDKMMPGNAPVCNSPSQKSLKVVGGIATIIGEPDTRTGQVATDGSLSMTGTIGTPPRTAPATVTGRFADNGFHGTSVVQVVNCRYEWTLKKS